MAGLTGSDVAYRLAIADEEPRGKTRADTTRSGYFLRDVIPVWINGAARQGMIQESISIDLNTGDEPHRCSFDFKGGSGFVPLSGHSVVIGHGSTANPLFSGRILKTSRVAARNDDRRAVYQCEAVGHVFEMGQASFYPKGFYARSLSLSSILRGLMAVTTPSLSGFGFSVEYVDPVLAAIGEFSTGIGETVPEAFSRAVKEVGGTWYVDHAKRVNVVGSLNLSPGITPSTITGNASCWGLQYQATDYSRAFSGVRVIGRGISYQADVYPSYHYRVPVESGSLVANQYDSGGFGTAATGLNQNDDNIDLIHDGAYVERDASFTHTPPGAFYGWTQRSASVFFPFSVDARTLIVVAENINSTQPMEDRRWYSISNQLIYVTSAIGVHSAVANSLTWAYAMPFSATPGAPSAAVSSLSDIAPLWNLRIPQSITPSFLPSGTTANVMVTLINSSSVAAMSTGLGGAPYGLVWKTIKDERLSPEGAYAVGSAALVRGTPANWATLDFTTRDRQFEIGRPVYISYTSPAESSGPSVAGTFIAQDVNISGFGRLTNTKGPERLVRAGVVRGPTLWQVLQGD